MFCSLCGELPLFVVDHLQELCRLLSIDRASNRKAGTQNLLCSAFELLGLALGTHLPDYIKELILGDVTAVLNILRLLAVAKWFFQVLDDEACGVWHNLHLGLTIL